MDKLIEQYTNKLERKQRLIQEYIEEKNSINGFVSVKRDMEYQVLYAEIQMLKRVVEDLKDIK